jgi:SPP1 family phage portal protein
MAVSPSVTSMLTKKVGIPTFELTYKPSDISKEVIEANLHDILSFYSQKYQPTIARAHNTYLLQHAILSKQRIFSDTSANNQVVEPHLYAMVQFKVGYVFGNPIKYSQTKDINDHSLVNMDSWDKEVDLRTIDSEVATWMYSTGVGYYFIQPRQADNEDVKDSPYEIHFVESDRCFKVYSSFVGKAELFDVLISVVQKEDNEASYLIEIYTKDTYYRYKASSISGNDYRFDLDAMQPRSIRLLPLVEKTFDMDKVGIVNLGLSLQNAIDVCISNSLDNIEDVVNAILVFINTNFGSTPAEQAENYKTMMRNGALVLNSQNPQQNPDVKTVSNKLDYESTLKVHDILLQILYDVCGVPLSSSSVTSGGDTGQARSLGNGWESAYNRALNDINTMIKADRRLLAAKVMISQADPSKKHLFTLKSNDIDIKYSPNISDNMLTKSQAYSTLINTKMPPHMALEKCKLSNSPEEEGAMIDDYIAEMSKSEASGNVNNGK